MKELSFHNLCRPAAYNFTKKWTLSQFFQGFSLLFNSFPRSTFLRNTFDWLLPDFYFYLIVQYEQKEECLFNKQLVNYGYKGFWSLCNVTRSSVLVVVGVLYILLHFIIFVIFIIIIIIIRIFIKSSLLFFWGKFTVWFCFF